MSTAQMVETADPNIVFMPLLEDTWGVDQDSLRVVQTPDPSYRDVFVHESVYDTSKNRFIIEGLCAQAGRRNRNNRTYPLPVIKHNMVENAETKMRLSNRSLFGECDHPCLTDDNFRVLTEDGWKQFSEIKIGEYVWARKNGKAVLSRVYGLVNEAYSGLAYKVSGQSIDSTFTPGHRFLAVSRPSVGGASEYYATIRDIFRNRGQFSHDAIPKTASWTDYAISETITIPGVERSSDRFKNDVSEPLVLDARLFSAFLGVYLAEGHTSSQPDQGNYAVHISQKTSWSKRYIQEQILDHFPSELKWTESKTGFSTVDARLHRYLSNLGNAYTKYIPDEVKKLSTDCLRELVYWFMIGDGRVVWTNPSRTKTEEIGTASSYKEHIAETVRQDKVTYARRDLFTVSERLIRDLHECLVKAGGCGTLSVIHPTTDYQFAGRTIKAENKKPLYQLHISQSKGIYLDPRFLKIDEVQHDGRIYCLQVDAGNFYMEQNGKSFWTGNSGGKTELKRVSHLVTGLDLKEDGSVWGRFEILDTPNGQIIKKILEAGGLPGFSSRGSGSVNKVTNEVQEDYKFQTIDIVSDPSTYGAEVAKHPYMNDGAVASPRSSDLTMGPIASRMMGQQRLVAGVELTPREQAAILSEAKKILLVAPGLVESMSEDRKIEAAAKLYEHEVLVDRCASSGSDAILEGLRSLRQEIEGSLSSVFGDTFAVPEFVLVEGFGGTIVSTTTPTVNYKEALQEAQRTAVLDRDNQILNASLEELQQAYGQVAERYETAQKVIAELTERYRSLEAHAQDAGKRLEVSEGIIEALAEKYENLQKQSLEESGTVSVFETREQAAASIIESAVRRIRGLEAIVEELGKRVVAGEKLCEAMAVQIRNSILLNERETLVQNHPVEEAREHVRKVLAKASTVAEMRESYQAIAASLTEQRQVQSKPQTAPVVEQVQQQTHQLLQQRQPVPTPATAQQLSEQAKTQASENSQVNMALMLESKLRRGKQLNG